MCIRDRFNTVRNSQRSSSAIPGLDTEVERYYSPGLMSGLVFAGVNSPQKADLFDDGIMTAEEISFLPLENVDLVTLSACETGLGKSAGSEGLIGIQRAFQISGASSTVASLWKVDDLQTRRLMIRFYQNMYSKNMPKLKAITEAQKWILSDGSTSENEDEQGRSSLGFSGNPEQSNRQLNGRVHPRYWAAWTLSGDWR